MSSRHPRATGAIAALAVFAVIATAAVSAPAMAAPPPDKGKPSPSATPTPSESPAPTPSETTPAPVPSTPAPTPSEAVPAPTDPAPAPSETVPTQPAPAPSEPARTVAPSAPAPLVTPAVAYPDVMAATGDSITLAYNSASYGSFPQYSWSTGSASTLNSLRQRLQAASGTTITAVNVAAIGANSGSLLGQVTSAINAQADYLTLEIGANDACTPTVAGMTSEGDFRARIKAALTQFHEAKGDNRIFVASIPNLYRMWSLSKNKLGARLIWSAAKVCPSMLVNPTSTTATNENRRLQVQARVNAYNAVLQQECSLLPRCTFDNYAVANYAFTSTHISTADYFHPSVEGQRVLATITWASNPYK